MLPLVPNPNANPHAYHASAAIEKLIRIFGTSVPAFLPRENPTSSSMNPACMNITSRPATVTHRVLMAMDSPNTPFPAASSESARASCGAASEASTPTGKAQSSFLFIPMSLLARRGIHRGGRVLRNAAKVGTQASISFSPL